jgi:valyl-tRNA synthetase
VSVSLNKDGIYVRVKKGNEVWVISKEAFEKFRDEWELTLIDEVEGNLFVGKKVKLPITGAKITVLHDEESKTEYGSGIVYWCTYGGMECIDYLTRHTDIKPIHIMDISGRYNGKAGKYEGMMSLEARKAILEDLEKDGSLVFQEHLSHAVNVHERCGTDIEYVATKQWFIKYLDLKEQFLKNGAELNWYPKHMKHRYDNWVKGLKWDWCISRQRFFGVPFPVWYCKECKETIIANVNKLPVDPLKDKPTRKCKCGSDEFIGEKDILDTWATSSLTPQLATELFKGKKIYDKLFPMSIRPQAHDIITFWLFNTLVKSQLHYGKNPWKDVVISGHALDPRGKKMSKSKGNVVEPQLVLEKYSSDALRFWAAGSKLGDDLPYQEKDLVTGQKFITKLWNASKFTFMHLEDYKGGKPKKLEVIDEWILVKLNEIIKNSTLSFEKYEYSRTKSDVENFFWHTFCDNYLEIVKDRLYNPDQRGKSERLSAQYGLYHGLLGVLKLMAPIMPHITEELYHAFFKVKEKAKSIHISSWPSEVEVDKKVEKVGDLVVYAVSKVRQAKSENNMSLKNPIKGLIVKGKISKKEFESIKDDLVGATKAESVSYEKLADDSKINEEVVVEL